MNSRLIENIGELITLAPLARAEKLAGVDVADLGRVKNAWLAIENGKVAGFGSGPAPERFTKLPRLDAKQGLVMPGLVDAHTHPIFGGNRSHEFCKRLGGATYQQIAAEGGGIKFTVRKTREAAEQELRDLTNKRLRKFLRQGVTTVEAKTGYGLSVAEELRHLKILNDLKKELPLTLSITCLALHALPSEAKDLKSFVTEMTEKLLPQVAKEKLADWVDAFVEEGYFSVADCESYFAKAKELGLGIRIHADEFTDSGSAKAGARWGARSADHLEYTPKDAIALMAEQKMVAVLLPGTSLYTKIPYTKAAPFLAAKCPIALATDFNPGSCRVDNLGLIATIGALHCGLDLPHAVAAVTYVPAYSLKLHERKGALAAGFDADVIAYEDYQSIEEWLAGLGQHLPSLVMVSGKEVH